MRRGVLTQARVRAWLEQRFLLRLHMFFILGGTYLAGLAATKLLLMGEVNHLPLRYAVAVFAAYLAFLALIRLWLWYVRHDPLDFSGDGVDLFSNLGGDAADAAAAEFGGGGGSFGGGGASGSWGAGDTVALPAKTMNVKGGGGGRSSWSIPDVGGDEGCVVIVILAALIALLFVAGIYLIWSAPAILAEAAFEALLAAALARRAKKIDRPGWVGVVWRATVWPFAAILVLSIALGWAVQHKCPEAKRLRDAFACPSDIVRP